MLASITPLGERGRDRRWGRTVTAYVLGSAGTGALLGAALGSLGRLLPSGSERGRLGVFVLACIAGLLLDARVGGWRLPTTSRQVDEDWLTRYRGWVYGVGFGAQLGLGVVTIVTTSTVYLTLLLELLSGSALVGALLGVVFGGVRALPVILLRGAYRPDQLRTAHRTLQRWAPAASRTASVLVGAVALGAAFAGWRA